MLNWDEYNNEEAQVAPAIKNTTPKEIKPTEQVITQEASSKTEGASIEEGSRAEIARRAITRPCSLLPKNVGYK